MIAPFPGGKRFAFTVIDDTDVATVDNVAPLYGLLERLGLRTTKTAWPLPYPSGGSDFDSSETLEDAGYRDFVLGLQRRGFEIASHGATMESSTREQTLLGLERMHEIFGEYPIVHANHANNRENLYWGTARIDDVIVRALYRAGLSGPDKFEGHIEGSPYWWGDVARSRIRYVRNLTFSTLNVAQVNPTMPYKDARRPDVNWWFSAADAEDCSAFNHLIRPEAQDLLEREGGVAIVATHFGKGFVTDGRVDTTTEALLSQLSRREGWFVPVGALLDWMRDHGGGGPLPAREWRRMQWRWIEDLLARAAKERARRMLETYLAARRIPARAV